MTTTPCPKCVGRGTGAHQHGRRKLLVACRHCCGSGLASFGERKFRERKDEKSL